MKEYKRMGFNASWSAKLLIDGFFVEHNFIRPHMIFKSTHALNVGLEQMSLRGMIKRVTTR